MSCDQKALTCERQGFMFRCKARAKHMLAGCTCTHGGEVVDRLHTKPLGIELRKRGGNALRPLCGFRHGCLFTKNDWTGLNITLNLKVSSETTDCEFDLVV